MKTNLQILLLCFLSYYPIRKLNAQSFSPQVIASAGGFQSTASESLSFTIGETTTQTLTSVTHRLTQGFQQPYKVTLNLKAFIQGYYKGGGLMNATPYKLNFDKLYGLTL